MTALALLTIACAACAPLADPVPLTESCIATDGDTLRCGDERIRLLAIDAPEKPGHCRAGRTCAPGDPFAATESLAGAVQSGPLTIRRVARDRYGRTLAQVFASGTDLSCHQLRSGHAIYVRRWDRGGAVRLACPAHASPG